MLSEPYEKTAQIIHMASLDAILHLYQNHLDLTGLKHASYIQLDSKLLPIKVGVVIIQIKILHHLN